MGGTIADAILIITPNLYGYGALLIGGFLKNKGINVSFDRNFPCNMMVHPPSVRVVGLSIYSIRDLVACNQFIRAVKTKKTDTIFVVGGPVAFIPQFVFGLVPEVDIVVRGEGEESIVEVMDYLRNDQPLDNVKGIAFRRGNHIIQTVERPPANLKGRPLPITPSDLKNQDIGGGTRYAGANVYLETHRGCSGLCAFCLVPRMFGRRIRSRPMDEIITEAKAFKVAGVNRMAITGGTTSMYGSEHESKRGEAFSKLLRNLSEVVRKKNLVAGDLRVDQVNFEILQAIKRYTTGLVSFGLESGSNRILRKMAKGIDVDIIREGVAHAKKHELLINGSFIVGYPGEEDSDFQATLELMRELKLHDYTINMAMPIPGTPLYKLMLSMKMDRNPFFQKSGQEIGGMTNLTIAEYRATVLQKEAYEIIYHRKCSPLRLKEYVRHFRVEGSSIAETIRICQKLENGDLY